MEFSMENNQQPSPIAIFDAINAYQRSQALKTAVELDLFTAIGEGSGTAAQLAEKCGISERGARSLCDYLATVGFLSKTDGSYGLTVDSGAFLDRRSPAYLGESTRFLLSPMLVDGFTHLTDAVRKGGTAMSEGGTVAPEHP